MAKNEQTPAAAASKTTTAIRVRFSPAGYTESGNIADAALVGLFPGLAVELAGFTINGGNGKLIVYSPKTAPLRSAPSAIQPMRVPAPDGIETDSPDGTLPAPGAKLAVQRFQNAMLGAWAECSTADGGKPAWGREFTLAL